MNPDLPALEELEKLPLYELISMLDDVNAGQSISYVPSTPVWPWIFLGISLMAAFFGFRLLKHLRKERYRKLACLEIESLADLKGPAFVIQVSQIMKKTALTAYPRKQIAQLHGQKWLRFLELSCKGTQFTQGIGQALAASSYMPVADVDEKELGVLAKKWVKTHKRGVAL